ncbi:MAG: hypothetical protein QM764_18830 [Chitinophagaceae bacterium]
MNETIAASVVLYHPNKDELMRNIASYLPSVSRLFIIDNTPGGCGLDSEIFHNEKTFYLANNKNEGIATALNQAATLAYNEKFRWLLTMRPGFFFWGR